MKGLKLLKEEKGFTLISVVVAIALLGLVAVLFATGISTATKAVYLDDERATAEGLAKSQIESIKNQAYIDYSESDHDTYSAISTPSGYSIELDVVPFDPDTRTPYIDQGGGVYDNDKGIQEITVTIEHNDSTILTLENYKLSR